MSSKRLLECVRLVDLTTRLPGPFCSILRDLDYTPDQIASLASERAVRC